ncbi:RelA/SpoT domain-containing protein [Azoarcus sp. L1K30]|uniref:GTP pyrophosphokinase n=1 Tax=Azoarcus sp. L1K30 TaxID=2820277 RepID=UPI001B832DBE|nr:RelA/SpoT domain-containing protein [Azoarcus sp. L1K30]MBR0568256.1 RelA/SpoT domain-containing protein [Azoarcus sp. L1K30]
MTESEIRTLWEAERPIYQAWSDYVRDRLVARLTELLAQQEPPGKISEFLKLPVQPRLKDAKSLVDKALFRDKKYGDPYAEITDKAGMRFVVLLSSHIRLVEQAILDDQDWEGSKDRDYEEERRARPLEFSYQSLHYVVRASRDIRLGAVTVLKGTACELQIRTLLQHAHSELTHDTIYKPKKAASPEVNRAVAKSMALIEAADDFFELVMRDLQSASKPVRDAIDALSRAYVRHIGIRPETEKSNVVVLDAFAEQMPADLTGQIESLILSKGYISERIRSRFDTHHLFRQPVILFAYLMAVSRPAEVKDIWPLTTAELKLVFLDLGISYDNL